MRTFFLSLIISVLFVANVSAQTGPAASKAKTMVEAGIAHFQKVGKNQALADFNDINGAFRDGEYYLFIFDVSTLNTAICIARGDGNKALIGKDMWATKDPDNQLYIQAFAQIALSKGSGWVDYKRTNPESKKIEPKSSYIALIPGTKIFIGCGFYKD